MQNSLDCTNKIDQQGVGCQREGPGNECATSQPGTANRNDLPLVYTGAGNKSRLGGVVGLTRLTSSEANFSYLDYIANPLRNVKRCPGWVTLGSCENGHRWAKELYCGREWCENCREPSQDRRFSRLLPKARQLSSMGYLVITFPPEDRVNMRTKAELVKIGKVTTRWARGMFCRGVKRWHFFGDQEAVYHPHLNFLVDGGKVRKDTLKQLRSGLKLALNLSRKPTIHYEYTRSPARMVHWLKYITRATFLDYRWDPDLAEELWNFRNITWWGKWDGEPAWDFSPDGESPEVEKLEQGLCPICGKPIKWDKAMPIEWLKLWEGEPVGAGYHRLHDPP